MAGAARKVRADAGQSLSEVYGRLTGAEWAVAHVAAWDGVEVNDELVSRIRAKVPGVVVEAVPAGEILANEWAKALVRGHIERSGLGLAGIPLGYYLIHRGEVVAFDPAVPTVDELKAGGVVVAGAAIIGLIFRAPELTSAGVRGTARFWDQQAAERAFAFFASVIDEARRASEQRKRTEDWRESARERSRQADDVAFRHACDLLGIAPNVTEREYKTAYRAAARREHPDHHPDADKPAAEARMKAVNLAADVYCRRRGWKR